jgi:hypothetical protein
VAAPIKYKARNPETAVCRAFEMGGEGLEPPASCL